MTTAGRDRSQSSSSVGADVPEMERVPARAARARQAVLRRVHQRRSPTTRSFVTEMALRALPARPHQPHARLAAGRRRRNTGRSIALVRRARARAVRETRPSAGAGELPTTGWAKPFGRSTDQSREAEKAYASALGPAGRARRARSRTNATLSAGARAHALQPGHPARERRGARAIRAFRTAEADFREAIRLLEPLARTGRDPQPRQDLARAYNNLASLLAPGRAEDDRGARPFYEQAIRTHEELVGPRSAQSRVQVGTGEVLEQRGRTVARTRRSRVSAQRQQPRARAHRRSRRGRRPRSPSSRPMRTICERGFCSREERLTLRTSTDWHWRSSSTSGPRRMWAGAPTSTSGSAIFS